jgi:DNA-binding FadR family transcriptional regulator
MAILERPLTIGRSRTLAEVVHEEMLALIEDGTWAPRMKLPSEAELCRQFGMSRPVIRQALARLRTSGLIQSRQGSGSFVCDAGTLPPPSESHIRFPPISSIADLEAFLNFREGVEGEAAAAAARRHAEAQLGDIGVALERANGRHTDSDSAQADYAFHLAIAAASNNPFYRNTLVSLKEHMLLGLNLEWSFSGGQVEFRSTVSHQHVAIVDAIARRDADAARRAMREHLRWARSKLVTGQGMPLEP